MPTLTWKGHENYLANLLLSSHHQSASLSNHKHIWNKWQNRESEKRSRNRKKEPNGKFITIKNKVKNLKGWAQKENGGDRERIGELREKVTEITQSTQQRLKKKHEQSFRDLGNYNKRSNSHVIKVLGKKKEAGAKRLLEEMTENFPNLAKDMNL